MSLSSISKTLALLSLMAADNSIPVGLLNTTRVSKLKPCFCSRSVKAIACASAG
jgi:hypothetical protein